MMTVFSSAKEAFWWRWLNRTISKKKVVQGFDRANRNGVSLLSLIDELRFQIRKNSVQIDSMSSIYCTLGGSNNAGFVLHGPIVLTSKKTPAWITKLAATESLGRESFLLEWVSIRPDFMAFFPVLISKGKLHGSSLAQLTTERLVNCKVTLPQAFELHQALGEVGKCLFENQPLDGRAYPALSPGTPIRDMIVYWVKKPQSISGRTYLEGFFQRLMERFPSKAHRIKSIEETVFDFMLAAPVLSEASFGFIHGDYKPDNIMFDNSGQPKVIDNQYFEYGLRAWDLGFFLSKKKCSLSHFISSIYEGKHGSKQEKKWLVVCYLLALCLRLNHINFEKIWYKKIKPALNLM
jgi:hypothetical protein